CPYCYIGEAELAKALDGRADVDIVHHAFRLSPDAPVEPVAAMVAKKYGMNPAQVAQAHQQITARAATVGLEFHTEDTQSGDTTLAHRLLLAAQARGIDLTGAVYRAYFTEKKNVFDADTLA